MQVVDFFDPKWHNYSSDSKSFFLYDEMDNGPIAFSVDESYKKTSVNVRNDSEKMCVILPIDHNINIKKEGNNDVESTCDFLITVAEKEQLIFGEIKTGRHAWESAGIKQLESTIKIFKANHDISLWKLKKAYVSNWRKRNGRPSTMVKQERFKDQNQIIAVR